jgi:hypothetical protein
MAVPAGEARDRKLAVDDVLREIPCEPDRDIRMRAAGIVRVGRCDQPPQRAVLAIGDEELAKVRH